jgi:hypothetical protein
MLGRNTKLHKFKREGENMKRFWQDLVAMHAASAYVELEGVEMASETNTMKSIFSSDSEQFRLQQI